MNRKELKQLLDRQLLQYNVPGFIPDDPISIPHRFSKKQDIEIMGLFAAIFAWGNRKTIIRKCDDLLNRMEGNPFQFVKRSRARELKRLQGFRHRTFNEEDLLYFVSFLHHWYQEHESLEAAFTAGLKPTDDTVEHGLNQFRELFFNHAEYPGRTLKHVASPRQGSACKRINMFLRWMVRRDDAGVDFGIWNTIKPAQLVCPLDVHVQRTAIHLGLLTRPVPDWKAAVELTTALKALDPGDPVKYDLALFGMGVNGISR